VPAFFIPLAVSIVFPFNADFTVAILFPPRYRLPTPKRGTSYILLLCWDRGAGPDVLQILDSRLVSRRCTAKNEKTNAMP
jgi:hypothetical protein